VIRAAITFALVPEESQGDKMRGIRQKIRFAVVTNRVLKNKKQSITKYETAYDKNVPAQTGLTPFFNGSSGLSKHQYNQFGIGP
jgi:hypothetical protein